MCCLHETTGIKDSEHGSQGHNYCRTSSSGLSSSQFRWKNKVPKKIDGVALNGIVVSVNEIPDGSADNIVEDISQELAKLREIAHALNIPNAEKINWTLICSSTSDSVATQKRLNWLIQECKEEDENKFGHVCTEAIDVVENFCAMHLGVNLRKAFLDGMKTFDSSDKNTDQQQEQYRMDTLVHE